MIAQGYKVGSDKRPCTEDDFAINQRMTSDSTPETEVVVSGATYTSRAINAAVNGAMDYVRERAGEGV